jgi:hypothetical protein
MLHLWRLPACQPKPLAGLVFIERVFALCRCTGTLNRRLQCLLLHLLDPSVSGPKMGTGIHECDLEAKTIYFRDAG